MYIAISRIIPSALIQSQVEKKQSSGENSLPAGIHWLFDQVGGGDARNLSAIAADAVTKNLINFRKQFKQIDNKRNFGKKKKVKKILDFNEALLRLKDASGEDIS